MTTTAPAPERVDDAGGTGLTSRVVRGLGWVAGSRLAAQAVQLCAGIVLARALEPADFGLAATVYVFVGLAGLFNDAGIARALLHAPRVTVEDLSSAFWANAVLGVVVAGVLSAAAPLIAAVYGQPRLVPMTWLVAAAFVLNVSVVPAALLERDLRYRTLALSGLGSAACGTVASFVALTLGAGVFSLVVAPAVDAVVRSGLVFAATGWRPRPVVARPSLRRLWSFSSFYTLSALLRQLETSVPSAVLGLVAGPGALGYFARAQNLAAVPPQLPGMAGQAVLPALATRRREGRPYEAPALRAHALATLGGLLLAGLLVSNADVLVPLVYGDKWRPSVEILVWLAIAALLPILTEPALWSAFVTERTDLLFRWHVVCGASAVVASLLGARWGALGMARALALAAGLLVVPGLAFGARIWGLPLRRMLAVLAPPVALTGTAVAASVVARVLVLRLRPLEPVPQLAVSLASFTLAALVAARVSASVGHPLFEGILPGRSRRRPRTGGQPARGREGRFAYLVLAHREPARVARLARAVHRASPDADVLLAYNGRLPAADRRLLEEAGVVRVGSGRSAAWGTFSLVERTLEGLDAARGYAWVVLVSGHDYPVASLRAWEERLSGQDAAAIMTADRARPEDEEILNRTRLQWLTLTTRSRAGRFLFRKVGEALPGRLRSRVFIFGAHCCIAWRRGTVLDEVWKGSQWMALSEAGVSLVLERAQQPRWRRAFRRSFAPDESFLQTIVATSGLPYLDAAVTMTRWVPGAAHPDELGPEDLDDVLAAGTPFARKLCGTRGDALAVLMDEADRPPGTCSDSVDLTDRVVSRP